MNKKNDPVKHANELQFICPYQSDFDCLDIQNKCLYYVSSYIHFGSRMNKDKHVDCLHLSKIYDMFDDAIPICRCKDVIIAIFNKIYGGEQ